MFSRLFKPPAGYTLIKTSELEEMKQTIKDLQKENQLLRQELQSLKDQISKTSKNSSKPPSSDGLKKSQSLRKKGQRNSGGQKGHPGHHLKAVAIPDHQIIHPVVNCLHCHLSLQESDILDYERRQVFDIPPLAIEVTEHQAEIKNCPFCGTVNKGNFPEGVSQFTQYGSRIKAIASYLTSYHYLSLERTQQFFTDLFNHSVSEGTIIQSSLHLAQSVEVSNQAILDQLAASDIVHFDESGIRVAGKLQWLHVASTPALTYYQVHPKRGGIAFESIGLLPQFQGRAIHDHWKSYFQYDCLHGLCNAHHLRELLFITEQYSQSWAREMSELLLEIHQCVEQFKPILSHLPTPTIEEFRQRYDEILKKGFRVNPPPKQSFTKKRGRIKQTPAKNLLDRLHDKKSETLAFMADFRVPFTNNLAERDVRMIKVKQKVSGSFRTQSGAEVFCAIRGYLSTARKNSINVLDAISQALEGNPYIPQTGN